MHMEKIRVLIVDDQTVVKGGPGSGAVLLPSSWSLARPKDGPRAVKMAPHGGCHSPGPDNASWTLEAIPDQEVAMTSASSSSPASQRPRVFRR
jgi:hypothetical protein